MFFLIGQGSRGVHIPAGDSSILHCVPGDCGGIGAFPRDFDGTGFDVDRDGGG